MHYWGIPLTLAYIVLFTWLITRMKHFQTGKVGQKLLVLFFFYKLLLGTALTLLYTFYYDDRNTADIFKYFDDSYHITRALWEKPVDFFKMLFGIGNDTQYFTDTYYAKMNHWFRHYETQVYNDNHTIIRFNALVRLFSGGYFHVHTVFMCFLSFWGMVSFFKGFALFLPAHKHRVLAFALFLFPSLNFWSAGVLKEGLMIFVLGNIFYAVCLLCQRQHQFKYYVLGLFSLWVSMYLKSYALAAMGVGLAGLFLSSFFQYKKSFLVYAGVVVLMVLGLYGLTVVYPTYNIPAIIAQKQSDFTRFSQAMHSGSMFSIGELQPTWTDIVSMAPRAIVAALFRPTPFETHGNPLMLLSSLEAVLIIGGLLLSFVFFSKPHRASLSMVWCCLLVILLLSTIIGLSTVNFGSLVRYKIPVIPFMVFICLALVNIDRIKKIGGKYARQ